MGLFGPTIKPGQLPVLTDIERLETRANLEKWPAANFVRVVGMVVVGIGLLVATQGSVGYGIACAISGGLTWAAGALFQIVYDIRTLMLRSAERSVE